MSEDIACQRRGLLTFDVQPKAARQLRQVP